jgi:ribosomal silencing factor RsfS
VFNISDLVEVLRRENCTDVCTIAVPKSINYVEYLVVVTCRKEEENASRQFTAGV